MKTVFAEFIRLFLFGVTTMSLTLKVMACSLSLALAATAAGCASADDTGSQTDDATSGSASLTQVFNTSDFNNVWRLEGTIGFFEGQATVVLMNATHPGKPVIRKNFSGGGMGVSPFSTDVILGSIEDDDAALPELGDCIAVKSAGGGRETTDEELRQRPEFGAFVYVSDPLSGAPKRPAWGVGQNRRPKVYKTVKACLTDPDRGWSNANPRDVLTHAINVSGSGAHVLRGKISGWELMSDVALVNVSHVTEPVILEASMQSGANMDNDYVGTLDVTVQIPSSVKTGDCIALKNVSGGRGFTDEETRAKEEFSAFLFSQGQDGKVFRSSAECLRDPSANH